jgi:VWFA-related protein
LATSTLRFVTNAAKGREGGAICGNGAMLYAMVQPARSLPSRGVSLVRRSLGIAVLVFAGPSGFATAPAGGAESRHPGGSPQTSPARPADVVAVDFYAVTTDGLPVADLKPEDVQLKVDGRARPVKWLEWIPVAEPPAKDAAPPAPIPAPYASNAERDAGRSFVLAIENESFRPGRERPLRDAVDRFLSALSPRDRVGLLTMPYGGFRVQPTNDLAKVRAELAKVGGQGSSNESGSEMACRTRRTLESLVGLVSGFSATEAPTNVLFVTSGMAGPRRDSAVALAPGMCELTVDMFNQVGAAAGASRAMFYVIQPEDLMVRPGQALTENIAGANFRGSDNPLEGIEHLAGVTGGERLHLAATGETTLVRIARETSAYYMLGFEVSSGDRNNASRQIDVRVAREGVAVRARPSVTIPRIENRPATKAQAVTPRSMLREARAFRDLPLRGVGYASHNPEDGKIKIICLMEPTEASVQLNAAAAGLFDDGGRLVAQWTADAKALTGSTIMGALLASKPGTYRLRLAATDGAGRSGTADYEIVAEVPTVGPVKISSLVLGLSRGGFVPRMLFGSEPVALGYFDLYGKVDPGVTASAEIARGVDGPSLSAAIPAALRAVAGEERAIATVALPIGALPAGDYVVRVTVTIPGHPPARILRTLRKN